MTKAEVIQNLQLCTVIYDDLRSAEKTRDEVQKRIDSAKTPDQDVFASHLQNGKNEFHKHTGPRTILRGMVISVIPALLATFLYVMIAYEGGSRSYGKPAFRIMFGIIALITVWYFMKTRKAALARHRTVAELEVRHNEKLRSVLPQLCNLHERCIEAYHELHQTMKSACVAVEEHWPLLDPIIAYLQSGQAADIDQAVAVAREDARHQEKMGRLQQQLAATEDLCRQARRAERAASEARSHALQLEFSSMMNSIKN